jgi:hypothetical protein
MKNRRAYIPNPATPRRLRPVECITDRAKRYRANANPPAGPKLCGFCGARQPRDIDHIDGDEGNGTGWNLTRLCRTCNARKAIVQKKAGVGTRTRQYNPQRFPAPPNKQPSFAEYVKAVLILRGDQPGNVRRAGEVIQLTDQSHRDQYTRRIASVQNPTFAEYAHAVAIHHGRRYIPGKGFTAGAHDEGGKVIHATPPAQRSEYARRIAAGKRKRGTA